jgi:hypothetical protein
LKAEDALPETGIDPAALKTSGTDPFAMGGFRLRRSQADHEFAAGKKENPQWLDLRKVLDLSRTLRGLPTAEDVQAGLIVAADWEKRDLIDSVPLDELDNDDQRARWGARLDAMQRILHYRQLAVSALQIERAEWEEGVGRHTMAERNQFPVPVEMRDQAGEFSLKATAPDGTELTWRLSPGPLR